jgi:MFS family permease
MTTAGCLGAFSVISDGLRERFDWSFAQVNLVNAIGNAALYLAYIGCGPMYDVCGEQITQFVGMITFALGYLLIWMAYNGWIIANVASISVFYIIAGYGACSVYMVTLGANAANFDTKYLGLVSGTLLLFFGVSGTLYSQAYSIWFSSISISKEQNLSNYLLFTTCSILIINTAGIAMMAKIPIQKIIPEPLPLDNQSQTNGESRAFINRVYAKSSQDDNQLVTLASVDITSPQTEVTPLLTLDDSMTPKQILKSLVFWLYTLVCILNQGLTYMANVNAMVRSSGPGASLEWLTTETTLQVTLCSVSQSLGRLTFGIFADIVARYKVDRTLLLLLAEVILLLPPVVLFMIELNLDNNIVLRICSVLVGYGFGATAGLYPSLTRTLFGAKYYGTASSFVLAGVPIGIFASNTAFGILYDQQLALQKSQGGNQEYCYGTSCFRSAFIYTAGVQLLSVGLALFLYIVRLKK